MFFSKSLNIDVMRHLYNYPVNLNEANSSFIRKYKNLSIHCHKLSGLSIDGDSEIYALDKRGSLKHDIVGTWEVNNMLNMMFGINSTRPLYTDLSGKLFEAITDELNRWLRIYFNEFIDETSIRIKNAAMMLHDIINLPKFSKLLFEYGFGMFLERIPYKYKLVYLKGVGYRYELDKKNQFVGSVNGKQCNTLFNTRYASSWFPTIEECWDNTFYDYGSFSSELCSRVKRTFESWYSATPEFETREM